MYVGKIIYVGNSDAIVLPRSFMRQLGWIRGGRIALAIKEGVVEVHNLEDYVIKNRKTSDARGVPGLQDIVKRARLQKD